MIPGHDQAGKAKGLQERAGISELGAARALSEISGYRHQVGATASTAATSGDTTRRSSRPKCRSDRCDDGPHGVSLRARSR